MNATGSLLTASLARQVSATESGCWEWTGPTLNGYGTAYSPAAQNRRMAHRVVYEALVGEIPDGMVLDHLCRNPLCVNPDHLELVTQIENLLRGSGTRAGENTRKTHCKRGHPFDETNTHWHRGERICRACARERYHRTK